MNPPARSQSGFVLIYTIVAMFLLAALILAGTNRIQAMEQVAGVRFTVEGQARQVAKSGLIHANAWFRSQDRQPVQAFAPVRDLAANPPIDETDDPAVGLVRSFQIAPGIWGRYTVRKGADDEAYTDQNGNGYYDTGESIQDVDGDGLRTMGYGVRDLSARHGKTPGSIWRIESEGEIFQRPQADLPLGVAPNQRLASFTVAATLTRAGFVVPGMAALITSEAEETKLKSKVVIESPTLGLGYRNQTGVPDLHAKAEIDAPTPHAPIVGLREGDGTSEKGVKDPLQVEEIFGVDLPGMKAIADIVRVVPAKPDMKTEPPIAVPWDATMVVTPLATKSKLDKGLPGVLKLEDKWPISGRGILIIDGDVEIGSKGCDFQGVLFVTGNLKWDGAHVQGMVAAAGVTEIAGKGSASGGRRWQILHDPDLVAALLGQSAAYEQTSRGWRPAPISSDGRPLEALLEEDRTSPAPSPRATAGKKKP